MVLYFSVGLLPNSLRYLRWSAKVPWHAYVKCTCHAPHQYARHANRFVTEIYIDVLEKCFWAIAVHILDFNYLSKKVVQGAKRMVMLRERRLEMSGGQELVTCDISPSSKTKGLSNNDILIFSRNSITICVVTPICDGLVNKVVTYCERSWRKLTAPIVYFLVAFFFPATALLLPFRLVRALHCVCWPLQGKPKRCRRPR